MNEGNLKFKNNLIERCYKFGLRTIFLTDTLPNKRSAWIITDQLVRSATSICANLIEAQSSSSRLEFKKFYEISLKSSNETKYWLNLIVDTNLADKNEVNKLLLEVGEIANMLASGVLKLKDKKF